MIFAEHTIGRAHPCMPATWGACTTPEHPRVATETDSPAAAPESALRQAYEWISPDPVLLSTSVHRPLSSTDTTAALGCANPVSGLSIAQDHTVDSTSPASSLYVVSHSIKAAVYLAGGGQGRQAGWLAGGGRASIGEAKTMH